MRPPAIENLVGHRADVLELDLRDLPAPSPMAVILEALESLGTRALLARTPLRPVPLLSILEARGFHTVVAMDPAGTAWLLITSASRGHAVD